MANNKNKLRKGENLATRSSRYARELQSGKSEITGKPLTNGQKRFRNGVLNERSISASQHKYKNKSGSKLSKKAKSKAQKRGAYNAFGRVNENLVDDRSGAVVFIGDDFDYDEFGNIKGHCIGGNLNKFEPD